MRSALRLPAILKTLSPLVGLFLALDGCKARHDDSGLKSLDNFARDSAGSLSENRCGWGVDDADHADSAFIDQLLKAPGFLRFEGSAESTRTALTPELAAAMKSIPTVLQMGYAQLGGSIVVTSDIQSKCSTPPKRFASTDQSYVDSEGAVDAQGNKRITSCWREVLRETSGADANGEANGARGLVIYVDATPASIHHGLVRAFGYAFSQYIVRWDADGADKPAYLRDADPEFNAYKEKLTVALLKDVGTSKDGGGSYDLALWKGLLDDATLKARGADVEKAWADFKAKGPSVASDFEDYVFAESFDSFYCSQKTLGVMGSDFKTTHDTFLDVAAAIKGLEKALPTYASEDALKNGSGSGEVGSGDAGTGSEVGSEAKAGSDAGDGSQTDLRLTGSAPTGVAKAVAAVATMKDLPVAPPVTDATAIVNQRPSFQLGFFGALFGGIGRAIGGLVRGIGYVGGAIIRGIGAAAVGLVRFTGAVIAGGLRVIGGVIQAVGRVGAFLVRGAVNGVVALAKGVGRVAVGAASAVGKVATWVVGGTGQVVHGLFGPFLSTQAGQLGLTDGDYDGDGVPDSQDYCSNTATKAVVHNTGEWSGCAPGQKRDSQLANQLVHNGYDPTGDYDGDGIPNDQDFCSNTPAGTAIHKTGEWTGCGNGQKRDVDVLTLLSAQGG